MVTPVGGVIPSISIRAASMIIDVTEIQPPRPPAKSATVIDRDGNRYDCWPTLLNIIRTGGRYDIETKTNERGYVAIKKAVPVDPPLANGANGGGSHTSVAAAAVAYGIPAPPPQVPHPGEGAYVGSVLAALIAAGKIETQKHIVDTTEWLRKVWYHTTPEELAQ